MEQKPAITEQAVAERIEHLKSLIHTASSYYVMPLFLIFSFADYIWYPNLFVKFCALRATTVVIMFGLNAIINRPNGLTAVQAWATIFMANCIWPLHAMVYLTGDPGTPYYAGLILIVVGLAGGVRFTWPFYFVNMAQTILPFLAIGLSIHGFSTENYFLLNCLFLTSIALIMSVTRWFNERLHSKELSARVQLGLEVQNRDQIIEVKTNEALNLHALSRQFSPQVVASIQAGKMSLNESVHQADICAIFVDIVGSTDKFIRLERDDLHKILNMYMEDVMGTFLKYDITIDKFLGDGFLGFSNDPKQYADYVERVIRAALEIKGRIRKKIDLYNRYWLSEFEISIGIASGRASVGFYGGDLHVKSYTAIGRVINLASRLGSAAAPAQILVSQDVLFKLQDNASSLLSEVNFVDAGFQELKGFESEKIRLYSLEGGESKNKHTSFQVEMEKCPHGHGILYLDQDDKGIYLFKCRQCDFTLSEASAGKSAA